MKRRWTILFYVSLLPLVGFSWLASKFGFSMWESMNITLAGLIVAALASCFAMLRGLDRKWPAVVVLVGSFPIMAHVVRGLTMLDDLIELVGVSALLILFGSMATLVCAIVILVLPRPRPVSDPVAPARVVDE